MNIEILLDYMNSLQVDYVSRNENEAKLNTDL